MGASSNPGNELFLSGRDFSERLKGNFPFPFAERALALCVFVFRLLLMHCRCFAIDLVAVAYSVATVDFNYLYTLRPDDGCAVCSYAYISDRVYPNGCTQFHAQ